MLALISVTELLLIGACLLLSLGIFAFWLWMLVDCVRNRALSDQERVIWVIVICLAHALGALVYLLAGRRARGVNPPAAAS